MKNTVRKRPLCDRTFEELQALPFADSLALLCSRSGSDVHPYSLIVGDLRVPCEITLVERRAEPPITIVTIKLFPGNQTPLTLHFKGERDETRWRKAKGRSIRKRTR